MPKYKSHSIHKPKQNPETGQTIEGAGNRGIAVWEPLDEAAKANKSMVERAQEYKGKDNSPIYTPKKGESPKEMQLKLKIKELRSLRLTDDQIRAAGIPLPY